MTYVTGCALLAILLMIRALAGDAHQDRMQRVQTIVHHIGLIMLCGGMLLVLAVLEMTSIAWNVTHSPGPTMLKP